MAEVNINNFESSDIDLKIEKRVPLVCKQYDDITLNFNIFDYGNPVDLSKYYIEFKVRQPNGNEVTQTSGIIKNNNTIKIDCIDEVTAVYGEVKLELDFTSADSKQKSSFVIVINVKESLTGGERTLGEEKPIALSIELSNLDSYLSEAKELNQSFASNVEIAKETQDKLDKAVSDTNKIVSEVSANLQVAVNLNTNLEEAKKLNNSLADNISKGTPLKSDLQSATSTASEVKDNLISATKTANDKLDEINSLTNGLAPKVESIESEINEARNGKATLLEGIKSLAGSSSGGSSTSPTTPVDSVTVTNLKSEVEAARMGENTLKLGIQGTVRKAIDGVNTRIDNLTIGNEDSVVRQEISDARNGELTLKAGIKKVVNLAKEELEKKIAENSTGIDEEVRNQIAVACEGYGSLQGKLSDMTSTINDNADKVFKHGNRINALEDVCNSFKDGANITVKQGVQNMIDASINGMAMPDGAITVEQVDALNANMMNVIICTEKSFGKSFFGLTDNMRVYSFANIDSNVVIKNGIYDKENKCIRSNGTIIESVAFCYD